MVDVFISYPRAARAQVEPIKAKLQGLGLDVFFDIEGIDGGNNFPDVIDRALRTSKAVLCCWSPLYFSRPWCMIECRNGQARDIMVPVALEKFDRFAPPADLQGVNFLNLADWRGDEAHEDWNRTLLSLGKLLGRELAPPLKKTFLGGVKVDGPAPVAPQATQARADILADLRVTWTSFPAKDDAQAVERFLARVRSASPGSGLEFEIEHHLDQSTRAADARAQESRRAEQAKADQARLEAEARAVRDAEEARRRTPGTEFRDGEGLPLMVTLPPGVFAMGSPPAEKERRENEGPQREVRIGYPLAVGKFPVTVGEWKQFVAATHWNEDKRWLSPGFSQDERHPVTYVSWDDANAFAAWITKSTGHDYRLLTEAEWEYACRAGTTTPFWWGSSISTDQANYNGEYVYAGGRKGENREFTTPVGSFQSNPFGLHDMHGNVWEWVQDCYQDTYAGAPTDGSAIDMVSCSNRVIRGGSWFDYPQVLRSAIRDRFTPTYRIDILGFRLARTVFTP